VILSKTPALLYTTVAGPYRSKPHAHALSSHLQPVPKLLRSVWVLGGKPPPSGTLSWPPTLSFTITAGPYHPKPPTYTPFTHLFPTVRPKPSHRSLVSGLWPKTSTPPACYQMDSHTCTTISLPHLPTHSISPLPFPMMHTKAECSPFDFILFTPFLFGLLLFTATS
jgi:hypothetical protein